MVLGFFPIGFWLLSITREEMKKIDRKLLILLFIAISIFCISFYSMLFGKLNYTLNNIFTVLQLGGLLSCVFWFTRMPIQMASKNMLSLRFGSYILCLCTDICIFAIIYVAVKYFLKNIYDSKTLLFKNAILFAALIAWNFLIVFIDKRYPRGQHV